VSDDDETGERPEPTRLSVSFTPPSLTRLSVSFTPPSLPPGDLDRAGVRAALERWGAEAEFLDLFDAAKSINSLLALGQEHREAIAQTLHCLYAGRHEPGSKVTDHVAELDADAAALQRAADVVHDRPWAFTDPARTEAQLRRQGAALLAGADSIREPIPKSQGGRPPDPLTWVLSSLREELPWSIARDRLISELIEDFYGKKLKSKAVGSRRRQQRYRSG
jgi:hypothetical protein